MANELCIQPPLALNMHEAAAPEEAQYCCFITHLEPPPQRELQEHTARGCASPCPPGYRPKHAEDDPLALDKTCLKSHSAHHEEAQYKHQSQLQLVRLKNQENSKLVLEAEANKLISVTGIKWI